jgi:hypothetical protein
MSLIKSNSIQIGQSSTATQNFTLAVPAAPDGTIKLARGNSGATTADIFSVNGSGAITGATISSPTIANPTISGATITSSTISGGSLTLATAQNTTSGTSIDFTGIPSWVKRITVMFNGVSASSTTDLFVQIGTSSGIENTGYLAVSDASAFTTAFGIRTQNASFAVKGAMVITTLGSNVWVMTTNTYIDTGTGVRNGSGSKTLGGTLDRVRITTSNGTDTFDAGSVNIMYEG